jgi:YVTN family beta-propeller protein
VGLVGTGVVGNTVSVIDTATATVASTVTVGNGPVGVTVAPDGKHVYVANTVDNTVSVITTATGAVAAPIAVGAHPIAVTLCPTSATAKRRK